MCITATNRVNFTAVMVAITAGLLLNIAVKRYDKNIDSKQKIAFNVATIPER